jgi:hypothetical protein
MATLVSNGATAAPSRLNMFAVLVRQLSPVETANLQAIQEATSDVALLIPTSTGLSKSILDAVGPLRDLLARTGFHDYASQGLGPSSRVRTPAILANAASTRRSRASLYRPVTKGGDPRIWFAGLGEFAQPLDTLAVVVTRDELVVFNLSTSNVGIDVKIGRPTPEVELLAEIGQSARRVATELLNLLQALAQRGPIRADGTGDTAIGRTLETHLGIPINSSRNPDFKGIELKSYRADRPNRKNLFAQVPDWSLSPCRSSAQILDVFGYQRLGYHKLYVTVSGRRSNAQGLMLSIDVRRDLLIETSDHPLYPTVAVWRLPLLRQRLEAKHRETFWVEAQSTWRQGIEYFLFSRVEHTRSPVIAQIEPLVLGGDLTMDHLIKDDGGRVVEKGPIFKVSQRGHPLLFPAPRLYRLT